MVGAQPVQDAQREVVFRPVTITEETEDHLANEVRVSFGFAGQPDEVLGHLFLVQLAAPAEAVTGLGKNDPDARDAGIFERLVHFPVAQDIPHSAAGSLSRHGRSPEP